MPEKENDYPLIMIIVYILKDTRSSALCQDHQTGSILVDNRDRGGVEKVSLRNNYIWRHNDSAINPTYGGVRDRGA
jgi:hypothetical protein